MNKLRKKIVTSDPLKIQLQNYSNARTNNLEVDSQSILSKIKRRSFTLTHNNMPPSQAQLQIQRDMLLKKSHNFTKNSFSPTRGTTKQMSILKGIIKKKQDFVNQNQSKNLQKRSFSQANLSQKRQIIKQKKQQTKKFKEYQFYDELVSNIISQIKNSKQLKQNTYKQKYSTHFQGNQCQSVSEKKDHYKTTNSFFANSTSRFAQQKRQSMVFRLSQLTADTVYQKKIASFIQFLYKVNFSNSLYVDLSLKQEKIVPLKIKIGPGNNSLLIKSLIKRRFWLQICQNKNEANFVWTQDTQKQLHKKQIQNKQQYTKQQKLVFVGKCKNISIYNESDDSKILSKQEIQHANQWFSNCKNGKYSCFPQKKISLITNHIPNNGVIGSKKVLFALMFWYYKHILNTDPFFYLPKTYHIIPGDIKNTGFLQFKEKQLKQNYKSKVWIVKPGQNTNRGNGISMASTSEIQRLIRYKQFHKNGEPKTFIVQKYIKPFLYNQRKFDIRHYLLITSINGKIKAYWYKEGYIRTSSEKYDLDELDNQIIHLTNDAIQKQSQLYGKYQPGNKISYSAFQRYLDNVYPHKKYNFQLQIINKIKQITTDIIKAGFSFLDPQRKGNNFQLFGLDFMIDNKFKPYLIEVNANPCLEISCPLLQRIIPITIQHTLRLALDPLLPPPKHYPLNQRYNLSDRVLQKLRYQLIFDEKYEGQLLKEKYKMAGQKFFFQNITMEPEQDIFQDEGNQLQNNKVLE